MLLQQLQRASRAGRAQVRCYHSRTGQGNTVNVEEGLMAVGTVWGGVVRAGAKDAKVVGVEGKGGVLRWAGGSWGKER